MGSYKGTLDAKNRVHIPSKLRQSSDVSLEVSYLTLGLDGCLFLFPRVEWGRILEKFDNYSFAHSEANFFLRMLMPNAGEVSPDGQNRILIPPGLAARVGITREVPEVRIIGMVRRIEIWSVDRFEQYITGYGKSYEEVAGQLLL